jgi:hypothetical protein
MLGQRATLLLGASVVDSAARWEGTPLTLLLILSLIVAVIMLLVFGRFSDQKQIK